MPLQTEVIVSRPTRADISRVMNVFLEQVAAATIPEPPPSPPTAPPPPVVYIGHGHSSAWRDLKDHLQDQHGYRIETYETGARAGHAIRDILASMAKLSSFAVLVMTAEDKQADGSYRARENVVHEVGLFQGTLGFDRAIVAIEEGVEPFSNLHGIQQLRFGAGNVKEIYGDVLATLRREFAAE
jgi:predicted nucleotide-binding protein